MLDYNKMQINQ